ncbi:MAG: hypothetical protein Q7T36_02535 [Fluviicoccus sp.]|uniref:hypothetical protein n=1 Tax=Fluviicoccus sp. TaxID=2003552 RepID=UPI00271CB335|nr:hypothetical protein [Fluviicoccus sp.]MDO8329330.1 hypothetical protein [Fluviicoccus sp.]
MSKLDTRAELIKLSRLTQVTEADLAFLEDVPLASLVKVRELATERVFSDGRKLFQNLASASKLMPNSLTAMIAEKAFGPLLCARVAGEMPYQRAVDLSLKMSIPFLAEVTIQIDPKRVSDIIRNLPVNHLKAVAKELIRRGEYLVLGGFVNYMQENQMRAIIGDISEKDLLHIGFFMDGKHQISEIIRMLPENRLRKLVGEMQNHRELWPEALALMVHMEDELKRQMGDIAVEQNPEMLDDLTDTVFALDLWKDALPLFACMSPGTQFRLINVAAMSRPDVLEAVVVNTDIYGLWTTLLPLVEYMSTPQREMLGTIVTARGEHFLGAVIDQAHGGGMWQPLVDVIRFMTPEAREAGVPVLRERMARSPELDAKVRVLAIQLGVEALL